MTTANAGPTSVRSCHVHSRNVPLICRTSKTPIFPHAKPAQKIAQAFARIQEYADHPSR
jgi:hypothetical protein